MLGLGQLPACARRSQSLASIHEPGGPRARRSASLRAGEGIYVFDDAGNRYIEGLAGLWCASLGFSEKRLVAAATRQMERLPFYHNFAHKAVEPAIDLAQFLVERAPSPMSKVFFTNSRSEANDTQVKLVWYYNNVRGRRKRRRSSPGAAPITASP